MTHTVHLGRRWELGEIRSRETVLHNGKRKWKCNSPQHGGASMNAPPPHSPWTPASSGARSGHASATSSILRGDASWSDSTWTQEREAAFLALLDAIVTAPALAIPRPDKPYYIVGDWSMRAIGGILCQMIDDQMQVMQPVAFRSRCLLDRESKYPPWEGEVSLKRSCGPFAHDSWSPPYRKESKPITKLRGMSRCSSLRRTRALHKKHVASECGRHVSSMG